jgi:hypothetical protein
LSSTPLDYEDFSITIVFLSFPPHWYRPTTLQNVYPLM